MSNGQFPSHPGRNRASSWLRKHPTQHLPARPGQRGSFTQTRCSVVETPGGSVSGFLGGRRKQLPSLHISVITLTWGSSTPFVRLCRKHSTQTFKTGRFCPQLTPWPGAQLRFREDLGQKENGGGMAAALKSGLAQQ